jgi:hypothetical protein
MTLFYKGVGCGTYLHGTDLRITGIAPRNPGATFNVSTVMNHIARGTTTSPHISLTKSYGVAEQYARNASRIQPTVSNPAYVYEIDIPDPPAGMVQVLDPVFFVASHNQNPLSSPSYHHDGTQSFLLGVVEPSVTAIWPPILLRPPGMAGGVSRPPNLSVELETMVFALRDSEVLVVGNLPRAYVVNRFDIS